jgi:hypothetical protein
MVETVSVSSQSCLFFRTTWVAPNERGKTPGDPLRTVGGGLITARITLCITGVYGARTALSVRQIWQDALERALEIDRRWVKDVARQSRSVCTPYQLLLRRPGRRLDMKSPQMPIVRGTARKFLGSQ